MVRYGRLGLSLCQGLGLSHWLGMGVSQGLGLCPGLGPGLGPCPVLHLGLGLGSWGRSWRPGLRLHLGQDPPISHTERIFSVSIVPLAIRRKDSQPLSSHWPHGENILSPCPPIGHIERILSVPIVPWATQREYSRFFTRAGWVQAVDFRGRSRPFLPPSSEESSLTSSSPASSFELLPNSFVPTSSEESSLTSFAPFVSDC